MHSLANPWLDFLPAGEAEVMAEMLNDELQVSVEKSDVL